MTSPQNGIVLTIVAHDDIYLSITAQREGWGDTYQKKAAVLRLSKVDVQKLGLKDNARVELMTPAGSVVVTAKQDATCEAGVGFMPSSLYTNRLGFYNPGASVLPRSHIDVQVVPTEKDMTMVSDLMVRRKRA